ncbi:MAG: sensor histidine kinase [Planctomycetota bacterium]|jgi:PAS domain S-box-containing protein
MRGEVLAPFDRASELLSALVPALHAGDADAARAAILGSDLPTRELLDLALRARMGIRRRRGRPQERAERERAADAALRALADREDAAHPEDLDRRRQLATQHRRLLALLTDGVATVRPSGSLLHANRAAREALGLKLRELKDTPLESLFADRKEGAAIWTNLKRDGSLRAREVDLRAQSGRTFPVRIAAARADGPDPRILLVFRDLTEIRHIRSRLLETEKLGAMAKIAGSVAHEIRNPLNALFLNADLLEDELREADGVPGPIEEILAVMREEIERLNGVIKNYLSLSKLSSANFEKLDLNQVVTEFVEEAEEWAAAKELILDLRLNRGEVTMRGDRNMIRRVLVNLVQNALEVTPRGGKVVIGTRRLVHNVKLWVRDSGPGLSKEIEAQLFQPFFSTRERGTGLGLYLIREIVMAHEGRVALRSIKPRGAQATVLLPRWKEGTQ